MLRCNYKRIFEGERSNIISSPSTESNLITLPYCSNNLTIILDKSNEECKIIVPSLSTLHKEVEEPNTDYFFHRI